MGIPFPILLGWLVSLDRVLGLKDVILASLTTPSSASSFPHYEHMLSRHRKIMDKAILHETGWSMPANQRPTKDKLMQVSHHSHAPQSQTKG